MQLIKNNSSPSQLAHRLAQCVDRVGGKRAMATATLISEAQLFRYISGESDLPAERLVAIAKAANVDAGWLLTGAGDMVEGVKKDARPVFRSELMVQVTQTLEELLVEFEKPFNPRQRARAITYLYNAFRHEETMREREYSPQKFDILKTLNFLADLRTEEQLEILLNAMNILEYSKTPNQYTNDEMQLFRAWCNLLVEGAKGYYSSYAGKVYLEQRIGGPLDPAAIAEFQTLIQSVMKLSGKTQLNWLDLGCGNGRHLAHIHKHMPNISAQGIELSQLGYAKCKELMDAEKLPKDSVIMADMRKIPLAGDTFDVVFARMSLHCLPYIPNSGLGMEEAFEEIRRVLKPGGIAALQFPNGHWRDYSMPRQFMNQDSVKAIAQSCKLEVVEIAQVMEEPTTSTDGSYIPSTMKFTYGQSLRVLLRK